MEFGLLFGFGVLALLLLQKQTQGAPTGTLANLKTTLATGKGVAPVLYQSPQLLAMGTATFGTDRNPASINLTSEKIASGSAFPPPQDNTGGVSGFSLTSMLDAIRTPFSLGLRGQPITSPSGGIPSTGLINSPIGVGPQAIAPVVPPPSNSGALNSGSIPVPLAYAAPNTPQANLVSQGVVIPAASIGSPTTAPLIGQPIPPASAPNTPVGAQTPPATGVLAPSPNVGPFQVSIAPISDQPLFGTSPTLNIPNASGTVSSDQAYPVGTA